MFLFVLTRFFIFLLHCRCGVVSPASGERLLPRENAEQRRYTNAIYVFDPICGAAEYRSLENCYLGRTVFFYYLSEIKRCGVYYVYLRAILYHAFRARRVREVRVVRAAVSSRIDGVFLCAAQTEFRRPPHHFHHNVVVLIIFFFNSVFVISRAYRTTATRCFCDDDFCSSGNRFFG